MHALIFLIQEVKKFMGDHPVSNITISKKSRHGEYRGSYDCLLSNSMYVHNSSWKIYVSEFMLYKGLLLTFISIIKNCLEGV